MFTVPKKDQRLRLIVDGRKVNSLMQKPPRMPIPTIHEMIDYVMDHEWALTVDGRSFFYQFPISEEVGTMLLYLLYLLYFR
jgi:hypothetical protein